MVQKCRWNLGFCNVTDFDLAPPTHRIAARIGAFTAAATADAARSRAVKKIMHRTALRAHLRLPKAQNVRISAKRFAEGAF
jgi:hypothetical protein